MNREEQQALKQWHTIPKDDRDAIEQNAYCASCRGMTTTVEYAVSFVSIDILLSGKCNKCGGPVNRVVEVNKC